MVVMTSQCGFEEIKKRNDSVVGMEIEFMAEELLKRKKSFIKPIAAIAAAIILLVMSSVYFLGGLETEAIPIALLTIDINPSIVLEVNSKQEVINIVPLNKEAEIFSDKSLKNKDVKVVFQEIIGMADELGYLADLEENFILLTTIFLEEVDNDFKNIPDNLKKLTEEMSIKSMGSSVIMVTLESDYETYLRAQKEETSVGKMEIFQRLESGEDGIILEELKEKKVKELLKEASKKDHPVFDVHPGNKGEKEHPVFDTHPGNKDEKNKEDKSHPVFDTHPGNKENKQHPVFDQIPKIDIQQRINPSNKNQINKEEDKNIKNNTKTNTKSNTKDNNKKNN